MRNSCDCAENHGATDEAVPSLISWRAHRNDGQLRVFWIKGPLFVNFFAISFEKGPVARAPELTKLDISARRPQLTSLMGLSTTHARFVREWRKSSHARSLSLCATPKRKAMFSCGRFGINGLGQLRVGRAEEANPSPPAI